MQHSTEQGPLQNHNHIMGLKAYIPIFWYSCAGYSPCWSITVLSFSSINNLTGFYLAFLLGNGIDFLLVSRLTKNGVFHKTRLARCSGFFVFTEGVFIDRL